MSSSTSSAALRRLLPLAASLPPVVLLLTGRPLAAQESTLPSIVVSGGVAARANAPVGAASRMPITPMQTPASVDVISREQLESRGDTTLVDAVTRSPGLSTLAHPGNSGSSLSARGFTDTTSVMRLYDGTRQYGGVGVSFPFDTWSVDRVEVLRGPAAVIHGDGAIGAVVNVVPKKPTRGPIRHEVQATVGNEGQRALAYGSGGAIDDRWSYRFDANGERADGWVDLGQSSGATVNGALQLDVSPQLMLKLSHAHGRQKPMRYFGTPLVDGAPVEALADKNYNVDDSRIVYDDRWTELSARWSPAADLVVRSRVYHLLSDRSWRNAEGYAHNPATGLIDRSDNTEIAHDQKQTGLTTDVSFGGTLFGWSHQVAIGFDVNRSAFQHTNNTYSGSSPSVDPQSPVPGQFASDAPFIPRYRNTASQHALFAENRILLSPQWSVVAGLRHDRATVTRRDLVADTLAFDRVYSNTGWRVGAVFQPRADLSLYAQFSKAADPAAGLLMLSPANSAFDASTGHQFEIGLKQAWGGGQGHWSVAAYTIDKKNLLSRDPANPALRVQVGQRSSRGVEGTVSTALARTVRLDANVALLDARYDDFTESVGGVAVSRRGNLPTDVPERLANLWLGWSFQPMWTVSGGLRHVGKRFADNANTLVMPAFTTTDLALQWDTTPHTTLSLRGFNVFDRRHYTTAYYSTTQWFVGPGRRLALSLNHRF